jgi:hypothetical protein
MDIPSYLFSCTNPTCNVFIYAREIFRVQQGILQGIVVYLYIILEDEFSALLKIVLI